MAREADLLDALAKCNIGVVPKQLVFPQANKDVIVERSKEAPLREITFQCSLCRRMQRNQAILAELGVTNDKTIRGYVLQPQIDGL
jgi:hypothetical protein